MTALGTLLLVAFLGIGCGSRSPELDRYLEARRKAGMSEAAEENLMSVAGVQTGTILVSFPRNAETGRYSTRYSGRYCPQPDAPAAEVAAMRAQERLTAEARLPGLRALADRDKSGFVTEEEASRVRLLFEFSQKANFIAQTESNDPVVLASALGLTAKEFRERTQDLEELVRQSENRQAQIQPLR